MTALEQILNLIPSLDSEIRALTETPFQQISGADSNSPVAPKERGDVRQFLTSLENTVDQLDTAISRLRESRAAVVNSHHSHSPLVPSISDFPNEVLEPIFAYVLIPLDWSYDGIYERARSAISISLVCKRWRNITLTMPPGSLWSWIPVEWHTQSDQSCTLAMLARSRSESIYLSLYVCDEDAKDFGTECVRTLSDAPFGERCRILDIVSDGKKTLDVKALISMVRGWPHLEQLTLPPCDAGMLRADQTLANLRRLQICLNTREDAYSLFNMKWDHLESLVVASGYWATITQAWFVNCFPCLKELFINVGGFYENNEPLPPLPLTHPTLRVFGLSTIPDVNPKTLQDSQGDDSILLDYITLPNLATLLVPVRYAAELEVVANLIQRSECRISTFVMVTYSQWTVTKEEVEARLPGVRVAGVVKSLFESEEFKACKERWYADAI